MDTYRISQLAERTGVPATTLRYYESAGLLPAARSPSGYRVYDEGSAQRLGFIASAKMLGLALEEIRDLLGVWEAGVCAHVRERMLPLVRQRLEDADQRRAELGAFSDRLAAVSAQLAGPAPEGACGPGCGCSVEQPSGPVPVELTAVPRGVGEPSEAWREAPVACTLGGADMAERTGQWRQLLTRASGRAEVPGGFRVTFAATPDLAAEVASLAVAEQECCAFFDITLHFTPRQLELTVRAPEAAAPLLAEVFGATA